jgi:hypothetical protein
MKDVETVMRQLSNLYEFNRRLKTFRLHETRSVKVRIPEHERNRTTPKSPLGLDAADPAS